MDALPGFSLSQLATQRRLPYHTESSKLNTVLLSGIHSNGIYEVSGLPGSGRTHFCVRLVREAQKRGDRVLWIETLFPCPIPGLDTVRVPTLAQLVLLLNLQKMSQYDLIIVHHFSKLVTHYSASCSLQRVPKALQDIMIALNQKCHRASVVLVTDVKSSSVETSQTVEGFVGSVRKSYRNSLVSELGPRDTWSVYLKARLSLWRTLQGENLSRVCIVERQNIAPVSVDIGVVVECDWSDDTEEEVPSTQPFD